MVVEVEDGALLEVGVNFQLVDGRDDVGCLEQRGQGTQMIERISVGWTGVPWGRVAAGADARCVVVVIVSPAPSSASSCSRFL
ncbi:hypothetical protein [Streptomyces sp. NPDC048521]|uniref:hypothetical protein n=1 Tax=Streptomyces sp. NPDC048521 TaxID=3365566 RepID=UPI003715E1AB